MNAYLDTTLSVYQEVALNPNKGLCCTTTPVWQLPGLLIPSKMLEMNYGCGSTVSPRDLANQASVLYVGVGGGMELLQFAYFNRREGGITGIDLVDEMHSACSENLLEAEKQNPWFKRSFIDLKLGNALELPVEDESIDVAAQNCLFNIFNIEDLKIALSEMYRVLKPNGRLVLSDPVADREIPLFLRQNDYLRALCLSGSLPLEQYLELIAGEGFGTIEIRARRLYRVLSTLEFPELQENIILYSIELCAIKDHMPADGPCIFTGKSALYFGPDPYFDDGNGHILFQNQPLSICDKTAMAIGRLGLPHVFISESSYHYDGGGCC